MMSDRNAIQHHRVARKVHRIAIQHDRAAIQLHRDA